MGSRRLSARQVWALVLTLATGACGDDSSAGSGGAPSSATDAATGGTSNGASTGGGVGGQGGAADRCGACGAPSDAGVVANPDLQELSGLVASRIHEGILYANNDSGDVPRFFALTLAGEDRGTFDVEGATARDWEEIAAGPCGDGAAGCLYLADLGDNDEVRDDLVLYRVREPERVGEGMQASAPAEAFPFSYPDGPHDAEAFVVHPATGVVTIFTKGATSRIYELASPLAPGRVAAFLGEVTLDSAIPLVTAADLDLAGETVAIRTYADVLLYPIPGGSSVGAAVLARAGCVAPHAAEKQGEAIAFLMNGTSYVTAPEGAESKLSVVECR